MMKSIHAVVTALTSKAVLAIAIAAGFTGAVQLAAAPIASEAAGAVKVTVNYKGSGTVDGSHRVWVYVFDTPEIGPASMPIAETSVARNGDVASFEVGTDRVWIAVAFDEKGVMTGDAPPPSGAPIGIYSSSTGAPEAVIPGAKGAVTLTFDDSQRMP